MAKAFSDTITTDDMSFGSNSYISNNDNWTTNKGNITYGNIITMGTDSRCSISKDVGNQKINYMKFSVKLDSDDHSLTTDNGHAVTGICRATYTDEDGNTKIKQWNFYPKYIFEDDYRDDNIIIQLGNNQRLQKVDIELINKENVPVKILKTGLNVSKVIDEDTIKTDPDIRETIDDIISDYISTSDLVIPLINDISEMNSKPDGAIARCSWIEGVEV